MSYRSLGKYDSQGSAFALYSCSADMQYKSLHLVTINRTRTVQYSTFLSAQIWITLWHCHSSMNHVQIIIPTICFFQTSCAVIENSLQQGETTSSVPNIGLRAANAYYSLDFGQCTVPGRYTRTKGVVSYDTEILRWAWDASFQLMSFCNASTGDL